MQQTVNVMILISTKKLNSYSVILHLKFSGVVCDPGPVVCDVHSLAGVHALRLLLHLLYHQSCCVHRNLNVTQAAGLSLQLRALSIVTSQRDIITSSWFGEAPDEDGGFSWTTVQADGASQWRCCIEGNVLHLLLIEYLQSWNTRHQESVRVTAGKENLVLFSTNSLYALSIDRCLLVSVFWILLQDLTACWEWSASVLGWTTHN